ncbi:MAG: hypothetical protein JWN87_275 [Frankiales bacterium]|nr:hypothetical protein [Frankiales bacterium]MCW2584692.1 hypothetical protein [Frankiales bacterium]
MAAGSVDHRRRGGRAAGAGGVGTWDAVRVLKELRGRHGGPHLGTRVLALALALLLAAPLTVLLWRVGAALVHTFV